MSSKKHIHKYRKINIVGIPHYACALDECTHYMPKHIESILLGKKSYCWECNEIFVLDERALKMDFPTCLKCHTQNKTLVDVLTEKQL